MVDMAVWRSVSQPATQPPSPSLQNGTDLAVGKGLGQQIEIGGENQPERPKGARDCVPSGVKVL